MHEQSQTQPRLPGWEMSEEERMRIMQAGRLPPTPTAENSGIVGRYPVVAIASAMVLGAVAGWLVKRKLFH